MGFGFSKTCLEVGSHVAGRTKYLGKLHLPEALQYFLNELSSILLNLRLATDFRAMVLSFS